MGEWTVVIHWDFGHSFDSGSLLPRHDTLKVPGHRRAECSVGSFNATDILNPGVRKGVENTREFEWGDFLNDLNLGRICGNSSSVSSYGGSIPTDPQVFCGLQGVELCQLVLKASTLQELVDAVSREINIPGTVQIRDE